VPAIKEAKKNRQIIVVTHNPNNAIACDSEGIIYCSHDKESLQYIATSIENEKINNHIIDVLEETAPAFNVDRVNLL
jgi:ABC-type lipoprotein export system ATPase subunit